MVKKLICFMLLSSTILLTSCIKTQSIEKIGIINAHGVDKGDENLLESTLIVFQFSAQSEEITKVVSGKGKTIDGALEDANHSSLYELAPGKIKLMLFGRELAEQGILPLLDSQARDARIPDLMYLSVSETTAKEVLHVDEQQISTDIGQFLQGLIENHSTDHNIPRKTLQDFLRIYYDVGQDNALPIVELHDNVPKLNGVAVFRGDRMVGKLTNPEIVLLNLMQRTVKERLVEMSVSLEPFRDHLEKREDRERKDELEIAFIIKKGKSKTKLIDAENLVFQTETKMEMRLLEQSAGVVFKDPKVIKILEKEVEKNMEARFNKLLTKLQSLESDPFGYGRYYKRSEQGKDMTNEEWREKYPSIEVKFKVEAEIFRHGVID